jgi:D-alanyl-D-alanine carboxypeptidase
MAQISAQRQNRCLRVMAQRACCAVLTVSSVACEEWTDDSAGDADTIVADPALEAQARAVLDRHLERQEFRGAVLAVNHPTRGDVLVSVGTTGPAASDGAVDPDVPWGIGSITKTFVAVVVLQLVEEDELDLGQSIEQFFPALPRAAEITVRQLLQHTSGLNEYFASPALLADTRQPRTPSELIDAAVALGPLGEPGAAYHYSNTNYIVLGELVAFVAGQPWHEAVHARILEPLGMLHTHFIGEPSAPSLGPGFGVEEGRFVDYTSRYDRSLGGAAGGLQSTASDLQRFARALLGGVLLEAQSETEMQDFVPGQPQGNVRHEYGLGLERYRAGNLTLYGHLGSSAAHSAFLAFEPESRVTAAVLINVEDAAPAAFIALEAVGML